MDNCIGHPRNSRDVLGQKGLFRPGILSGQLHRTSQDIPGQKGPLSPGTLSGQLHRTSQEFPRCPGTEGIT